MFYSDPDRTIHYEGNVDIKQGTDRLGGVADIYLAKESNEMQKTVAQQNVVLTQPMRKGNRRLGRVHCRRRNRSAERQSGAR